MTTETHKSDEPERRSRYIQRLRTALWSPVSGGALTTACDGTRYGGGKRWSAYKKSMRELNCTSGVFGNQAPFYPKVCSCHSGVWLPDSCLCVQNSFAFDLD